MGRWLVWVALIAGCDIEDQLVECPGDVLCPVGTLCNTVHGGCMTPDQARACEALTDGDSCTAGAIVGYCRDGICIDPGCGNHVVDPGELCDDGNRKEGDGCAATCASRERCGDGVVEPAFGEECDDANFLSRDGCDSACQSETSTWTVDDIGPTAAMANWMTYDPVRAKVVLVADGYVWGWDGVRWSVLADDAPRPPSAYDVVFDTARQRLLVVSAPGNSGDAIDPRPPRSLLYEWDGTTWTFNSTVGAPRALWGNDAFGVVYDPVRQRVFGYGYEFADINVAQLDVTTRTWTTIAAPATAPRTALSLAFDAARGKVVVVHAAPDSTTSASVHEWGGSTWTSATAALPAAGSSLVYDARLAKVLAIGDYEGGTSTTAVAAWSGTTWQSVSEAPRARRTPALAFDTARNTLVVFGGANSGTSDDVVEWNGTTWRVAPPLAPPVGADAACAFDLARHRLICAGRVGPTTTETWAWQDGWTRLSATIYGRGGALTYHPLEAAVVTWDSLSLAVLRDDAWEPLYFPEMTVQPSSGIAFDATQQHLVVALQPGLYGGHRTLLISPAGEITEADGENVQGVAYDARNGVVVGMSPTAMRQLVGTTWMPIVGPGAGFTPVTNPLRGSVQLIAPGVQVLERIGSTWTEHPGVPPRVINGPAAIDPRTGDLHVIGADGTSRFMLHRRITSSVPLESCSADEDLDGDGLAGCDDPDCWWTCRPSCPPYATCP